MLVWSKQSRFDQKLYLLGHLIHHCLRTLFLVNNEHAVTWIGHRQSLILPSPMMYVLNDQVCTSQGCLIEKGKG